MTRKFMTGNRISIASLIGLLCVVSGCATVPDPPCCKISSTKLCGRIDGIGCSSMPAMEPIPGIWPMATSEARRGAGGASIFIPGMASPAPLWAVEKSVANKEINAAHSGKTLRFNFTQGPHRPGSVHSDGVNGRKLRSSPN